MSDTMSIKEESLDELYQACDKDIVIEIKEEEIDEFNIGNEFSVQTCESSDLKFCSNSVSVIKEEIIDDYKTEKSVEMSMLSCDFSDQANLLKSKIVRKLTDLKENHVVVKKEELEHEDTIKSVPNLSENNSYYEEASAEENSGVGELDRATCIFTCAICNGDFTLKSSLKVHLNIHTKDKLFECEICKKSFLRSNSLSSHRRIHIGEKPYQCDVCKKSFRRKSNIQAHMRIHTGDKPYSCNLCDKSFNQMSALLSHTKTHTGEKPYKCDVCKVSFSLKHNLSRHMKIHTGEKPYSCDFCKKSFAENHHLLRHSRIHTGEIQTHV